MKRTSLLAILPFFFACATHSKLSGVVRKNVLVMPDVRAELHATEYDFTEQLIRYDLIEKLPQVDQFGQAATYGEIYGRLWAIPLTLPYRIANLRKNAYRNMWSQEEVNKRLEEIVRDNEQQFCFFLILRDHKANNNFSNENQWHAWLRQNGEEGTQKGTLKFDKAGTREIAMMTEETNYGRALLNKKIHWWEGTLCFAKPINVLEGFGLHIEPRYFDDARPIDLQWDRPASQR